MIQWRLGLAMVSPYDDDGFLGVQSDAIGEANSGVIAYEALSQGGCLYRPLDPVIVRDNSRGIDPGSPDPSQSCTILQGLEGGSGYSWCLNDPRVLANLPALKKGEAIFFGSFGAFLRFMADGSAVISTTTDGTMTGGQTVQFSFGPKGVLFAAPWGQLRWNASEFTVEGPNIGRMALEYVGGMPGPLAKMTSNFSVQTSAVSIEAGLIAVGADDGTTDGGVKWTPFAAFQAQVIAVLQSLTAGVAAIPTGGAAAAAPAQAQLALMQAQLAVTLAAMKSRTATG